jgi:hypothetical protein
VKLTKEDLAALRQEHTARALRGELDCLSSDLLARAAVGELSEAQHQQVASHLASCSDCAEEYRLLAPLEDWARQAADSVRPSSAEGPAIIRLPAGVQDPTKAQQPPNSDNVLRRLSRPPGARGYRMIPYALAASFLILCLVLGFWAVSLRRENQRLTAQAERERSDRDKELIEANQALEATRRKLDELLSQPAGNESGKRETEIAELRQRIEELSRPQFNVSITDLEPRGSVRGSSADGGKTIEIPAGASFFAVILNVSGQPAFRDYALEVQDRDGKIVWSGRC